VFDCKERERETELDTWWKLDSECDCKENSTEQQQCKDNNVIAKRKTGIGDRWETRSPDGC
jgi:hypothetical protein